MGAGASLADVPRRCDVREWSTSEVAEQASILLGAEAFRPFLSNGITGAALLQLRPDRVQKLCRGADAVSTALVVDLLQPQVPQVPEAVAKNGLVSVARHCSKRSMREVQRTNAMQWYQLRCRLHQRSLARGFDVREPMHAEVAKMVAFSAQGEPQTLLKDPSADVRELGGRSSARSPSPQLDGGSSLLIPGSDAFDDKIGRAHV